MQTLIDLYQTCIIFRISVLISSVILVFILIRRSSKELELPDVIFLMPFVWILFMAATILLIVIFNYLGLIII